MTREQYNTYNTLAHARKYHFNRMIHYLYATNYNGRMVKYHTTMADTYSHEITELLKGVFNC